MIRAASRVMLIQIGKDSDAIKLPESRGRAP